MTERLSEYFAHESSEYLEQLDRLLAEPGIPDPEEMLRLARGVRGSAQMAGVDAIAKIAERVEDAVGSVISRGVVWTDEIRELVAQTVRDIEVLIRSLHRWGPAEEALVHAAIGRWDHHSTGEAATVVPIASLFYDDTGPHVLSEPDLPDDVVPIESLLLRGDAALREALSLRPSIESAARSRDGTSELDSLVRELFDLIGLAGGANADAAATG